VRDGVLHQAHPAVPELVAPTWRRGVGLAAVYETVEQLHGKLAVRSNRGEGTEFEATVPVHGWVGVRHSLPPATSHK
jgi:signal transduction histidine kinase